jgi:peptide/nickel transport system substrate-binding protein
MMHYLRLVSRTVLALSIILAGIFSFLTASAQNYVIEKLVIEQGSDTASLDPQMEIDTPTGRINMNIYDPLFRRDSSGKIQPHLVESFKMLDPLTWEFKLRKGVKFHNGEDFNAETVKFSIERGSDKTIKPKPRLGRYYTTFKSVEVVDSHTVRIVTHAPDPIVVNRLTGFFGPMVPPNYIKKHGQNILQSKPIGTGAFKFVRWDKDEKVELEANENYWGQKPKIKRVVFRPVPEITTRLADLELGRADIVTDVPPEHIERIKKNPDVKIAAGLSSRNIHIILNTVKPGPIGNKKVRQALQYAVDVDAIIKNILGGYGRAIATLFVPESFGYDPSIKPYPYDPEKAKQMLTEAGYPNGFEVKFDHPSGRYLKGEEVAETVIGQLARVGVTAKIQKLEWGTYVKRWRARKLSPLALIGAGDMMLDNDQLLTSRLISDANYGGFYSNPRMDELILKGRKTMNAEERLKIYSEAQKLIKEDCPILPLYQQPNIYGISKRIEWTPVATEVINVDTISPAK